jgi:heme-degrading monooxygenase HmoA
LHESDFSEAPLFSVMWEFVVLTEKIAVFENSYGPAGSWVSLFRKCPGFLGSSLLRDAENPLRYLTIDRWESAEHHAGMHREFATEYAALDRDCVALTETERCIGSFEDSQD